MARLVNPSKNFFVSLRLRLGNVFVHEWSKFRYGVFEEFGYPGDPIYPMFYYKTTWTPNGQENVLTPNFCTDKIITGVMQ